MRKVCIAAVMLAIVAAGECRAGAWLQEQRRSFISLSHEVTTPHEALSSQALAYDPTPPLYGYTSVYAERGVTDWLTVGLDAGREDERGTWTSVVFLRVPLAPPDWRGRVAAELGWGQRSYIQPGPFYPQESREEERVLRVGLSYGLGFTRPFGGGWLAADGRVDFRDRTGGEVHKLDLTLGLRATDRTSALVQIQSGDYPQSRAYTKLVIGAVRELPLDLALETGLIYGLREDDRVGIKTGLWWRF